MRRTVKRPVRAAKPKKTKNYRMVVSYTVTVKAEHRVAARKLLRSKLITPVKRDVNIVVAKRKAAVTDLMPTPRKPAKEPLFG